MKQKRHHFTGTQGRPIARQAGMDIHVTDQQPDGRNIFDIAAEMVHERRIALNQEPKQGFGKLKRHPHPAAHAIVVARINAGHMIKEEEMPDSFQANNQGAEARRGLVAALGVRQILLTR